MEVVVTSTLRIHRYLFSSFQPSRLFLQCVAGGRVPSILTPSPSRLRIPIGIYTGLCCPPGSVRAEIASIIGIDTIVLLLVAKELIDKIEEAGVPR